MKNLLSRIGTISATLGVLLALTGVGCNQGAEGDRCNPDLGAGHDECGSGLKCTQPVDCPENYCCPTSGTSSNPYCQRGCNGGQASICAAGGDADCPGSADAQPVEAAPAEASPPSDAGEAGPG